MTDKNISKLEKLRLLTPILTAITLFLMTAVWNDIGNLKDSVSTLNARLSAVEAQVNILLK